MFRISKSVKSGLAFTFLLFVWIHVYVNYVRILPTSLPPNAKRGEEKIPGEDASGKSGGSGNGNGIADHGRLGTPGFINIPEPEILTQEEIKTISLRIQQRNEEQKIYNLDKFGPLTAQSFVMVIQVHSRVEYLSLLIESLSRVQSIEESLIIFSHDLFVPQLNEAIQNIDFARVMQIFLPHTLQLNPDRFPGQSPDDCQRDISPVRAREIKCRNADHPDVHGHYREAKYTQTKHHWWWKANFVFGGVRALQNYTGVITFLEEDHYVTPDFLWILNLMETLMSRNFCQGCNLLALGTYLKTWNIRSSHDRAVVTNWISSKHNMGMAFNRTMWDNMKNCANTFCQYDDYNWDWSLLQMSYTCLKTPLTVLYAKAPRIFHIGDCGTHHKKKLCNPTTAAQSINKGVEQFQSLLFPDNLVVEVINGKKVRLKKGNGGWGDIRDQELCLSF